MKIDHTTIYEILRNIYGRYRYRDVMKTYSSKAQMESIDNGSICFITHELGKTGAVVLLLNILKNITQKGISTLVISPKVGPLLTEFLKYTPVYITGRIESNKLPKVLKERFNCTTVIYNSVASGIAVKSFKSSNYHIITYAHEMGQLLNDYPWIRRRAKLLAKHSEYFVFPSSYVEKSFRSVIPVIGGEILIRNQGLFYDIPMADPKYIQQVAINYGIPLNKKIVLNVATQEYRKGFDIFIDVAKGMHQQGNKDIMFVWVGGNNKSSVSVDTELDNLKILGYITDPEELNAIFQLSEIFLLTSREDPFPSVVLQALNTGTPVIAFDRCGGFVDVIHDSENGFLIEPFDINDIILKIQNLTNGVYNIMEFKNNCVEEAKKHSFEDYCIKLIQMCKLYSNAAN